MAGWSVAAGPVSLLAGDQPTVGLVYTAELRRNILSILLVTYLPTLLMNLINQATNYISSPEKYELIITVNITCMMVLTSVYLSVSSSLPTTADIKPVEWWLLLNLAYPGFVIFFNILIQVNKGIGFAKWSIYRTNI